MLDIWGKNEEPKKVNKKIDKKIGRNEVNTVTLAIFPKI